MMTYDEFISQVIERLSEVLVFDPDNVFFYQKGFTSDDPVEAETIRDANRIYFGKENSTLMDDFLVIKIPKEDGTIMQRIAINILYEDAKNDGLEAAIESLLEGKEGFDPSVIDQGLKIRAREDYDGIRKHLIIRPLNYRLHFNKMKDSIYRRNGDIALVLYQLVGNLEKTLVSSKIRRDDLIHWGMQGREEEILEAALENTAK